MATLTSKMAIRKSWPFLLIIALVLAARFIPGPRTIDDSFITFRYARNLLAGSGFVYNPGERVLGTTTPLYTLLMAGLGALTGGVQAPFPTLALTVNALADAATACLLLWLGRRIHRPAAGLAAALVWALAPFSVSFAVGGLETSLYVFLLTAALCAHLSHRKTLTALLAALALLTRPDALLLIGLLVLARLWEIWRTRPPLTSLLPEAAALALPAAAWYGFAWRYFGSPLPHSVQAKLLAYHLSAEEGLIRLVQHFATPFMEYNWLAPLGIAVILLVYLFLYYLGARTALKTENRLWPWVVYPWFYAAVFAIANPLIFRWYLTPPLPAYFFFIMVGLEVIVEALTRKLPRLRPVLLVIVLALPLVSTLSDWRIHPDHGPDRPAPEMAFIKLELLYSQAADYLAPLLQPGDRIAAGDVGVLGYQTGAVILDTVGLNSAQSTGYYPLPDDAYVINYAIPAALILDEQPEFVVILEVYGRNTLLQNANFLSQYTLLETLPTDIYGTRGMQIWQRN
jgi:4-amino-4-deoxy-L-arabinose transferase-like glycosyltransferase